MFVKICCIADIAEARLAMSAGASALGLVSAMPSGPGPIAEEEIAAIAKAVPQPTQTFLLTALVEAEAIAAQQRRCGTTAVQLVDAVEEPELRRLRRLLPDVRLVQVIHVTGPESLDEARAAAPLVDTLLLDSGNPKLAVKELGGTGRVHDWATSRRICESVDRAGAAGRRAASRQCARGLRARATRGPRRVQRLEAQWAPGRSETSRLLPRHPLNMEIPMIGYVSVGTNDWKRALAFYDALMAELGAKRVMDFETFVAWSTGKGKPGFALAQPHNKKAATVGNGSMVAFAGRQARAGGRALQEGDVARRDRRRASRRSRRQLLRRLFPRPRRQQAELPLLDMSAKAFAISTFAAWADMDANAHMTNFAYLSKCVDARMASSSSTDSR